MCFLCAIRVSQTQIPIAKIYPDSTFESYSLILEQPVFVVSLNVIALYLCTFQISKAQVLILKNSPSSEIPPSDSGLASFCGIIECYYPTSKTRIPISKISSYPTHKVGPSSDLDTAYLKTGIPT